MDLTGFTIKDLLDEAERRLAARAEANRADFNVGREYSLARTAVEDAKMRTTRALAKQEGIFNEVDLEKGEGIARARENHAANVAGNVSGDVTRS